MARDATDKEIKETADVRTRPPELPTAQRPGTKVSVPRIGTPSPKPRMPRIEAPRPMLTAKTIGSPERSIPLPRRTLANLQSGTATELALAREVHAQQMAAWRKGKPPAKRQVSKSVRAWVASLPSTPCQ